MCTNIYIYGHSSNIIGWGRFLFLCACICMQANNKGKLFKSIPCNVLAIIWWINKHLSYTGMKKIYTKSHTILIAWNCLVLFMPTNERLLNAICNKTETTKAFIFTYRNQKQPKRFCTTYKSNGTCDNAIYTNITIQETCVGPENGQMGCWWLICRYLFAYTE